MSDLHSDEMKPTASQDEPLFAGYEPPEQPDGLNLSAGQRLTLRQVADIALGNIHPLTRGALHPAADRRRTRDSKQDGSPTCGNCVFRALWGGAHQGTYPKCSRDGAWRSNGPATDVRAWWPACIHHQPEED